MFSDAKAVSEEHAIALVGEESPQISMDEVPKYVEEHSKGYVVEHQLHIARSKVCLIHLTVGYSILIWVQKARWHNNGTTWTGLSQIFEAKFDQVFIVENLQQTERDAVQALQIVNYPAQQCLDEIPTDWHEKVEYLCNTEYRVHRLLDAGKTNGQYEILVQWEGWPYPEDMTWKQCTQLRKYGWSCWKGFAQNRDVSWNHSFWIYVVDSILQNEMSWGTDITKFLHSHHCSKEHAVCLSSIRTRDYHETCQHILCVNAFRNSYFSHSIAKYSL